MDLPSITWGDSLPQKPSQKLYARHLMDSVPILSSFFRLSMNELYVISARVGMSEADLKNIRS